MPQQLPMARDVAVEPTRRQHADRRHVVVQGQADLLEVVDALDAPGRLARRLHGGQEQGDQHRDDRDDDQQLDQGEGGTLAANSHRNVFRGE